jgi:hypothetical protein
MAETILFYNEQEQQHKHLGIKNVYSESGYLKTNSRKCYYVIKELAKDLQIFRTTAYECGGVSATLVDRSTNIVLQRRQRCFDKNDLQNVIRSANALKSVFPIHDKSARNMQQILKLYELVTGQNVTNGTVEPLSTKQANNSLWIRISKQKHH